MNVGRTFSRLRGLPIRQNSVGLLTIFFAGFQIAGPLTLVPALSLDYPEVLQGLGITQLQQAGDTSVVFARVAAPRHIVESKTMLSTPVLSFEGVTADDQTVLEIATVLPYSGPPVLAEFARLVTEGVEVAVATALGEEYQVSLISRDDQGDPRLSAEFVTELENAGVAGVVGFLEDLALEQAGRARNASLPIVSPTARSVALAGADVYSLEGSNIPAATSMGRYAANRAFQRVAIVMPDSPHAIEEADAFQAEAASFGIPVVGRFLYQPGATFFQAEIVGARDALRAAEIRALGLNAEDTLRVEMLEPVGVFLPIPPEDIEYLAPQIAHFALDTLAIEVMGTSGWTDPQVLMSIQTRYTDGVVATAPDSSGPDSPGQRRFQAAYEAYFQRTLVSPTPAIGYDASLLLLEALSSRISGPIGVSTAFQELRDIEGATGIFSVIDGRIVRRTEVVEINNRSLRPVYVY